MRVGSRCQTSNKLCESLLAAKAMSFVVRHAGKVEPWGRGSGGESVLTAKACAERR